MSALPSAAAAIGSGFLGSLWQFFESWWSLVPLSLAVLMTAASWYLRSRSSITHMVFLPPGGEIGDDVIAMVKRHDSVTEAIDVMEREWNRKQGDGRG